VRLYGSPCEHGSPHTFLRRHLPKTDRLNRGASFIKAEQRIQSLVDLVIFRIGCSQ